MPISKALVSPKLLPKLPLCLASWRKKTFPLGFADPPVLGRWGLGKSKGREGAQCFWGSTDPVIMLNLHSKKTSFLPFLDRVQETAYGCYCAITRSQLQFCGWFFDSQSEFYIVVLCERLGVMNRSTKGLLCSSHHSSSCIYNLDLETRVGGACCHPHQVHASKSGPWDPESVKPVATSPPDSNIPVCSQRPCSSRRQLWGFLLSLLCFHVFAPT